MPIVVEGGERFDLAMSVEVAEHLHEASAKGFVASLTRLSDVVLFGSAFSSQGGTNHVNEQPHIYWAKLFETHDYAPYVFLAPHFGAIPTLSSGISRTFFSMSKEVLR